MIYRIEKRECKDSNQGWTRWVIIKNGRIWGYADTEEEAYRIVQEEG